MRMFSSRRFLYSIGLAAITLTACGNSTSDAVQPQKPYDLGCTVSTSKNTVSYSFVTTDFSQTISKTFNHDGTVDYKMVQKFNTPLNKSELKEACNKSRELDDFDDFENFSCQNNEISYQQNYTAHDEAIADAEKSFKKLCRESLQEID